VASGTGLLLPAQAFSQLPNQLRDDLLNAFAEIVSNFAEGRWEPAELNGGKLCEAAYSICEGLVSGTMPARASKPQNMVLACQALERTPAAAAPLSVRIQIPRMLVALYEIRNNRNVGHVSGDVDPNHMDAVCVLQMSKWIVAELVRVLHQLPVNDAAELVDALVEREVQLVWKVGGKKRVLDPKMSAKDKTLLLLHSSAGPVAEEEIFGWAEHSNASVYRRDILRRAHNAKLVEYDPDAKTVALSPTGVAYVEKKLIGTRP
jgi:hypothetical protein